MKGKIKLEKAPTSRSRCHNCGEYIKRGKYRLLEIYHGRFMMKDKYCASCGCTLIRNMIKELKEILKTINNDAKDEILHEEG